MHCIIANYPPLSALSGIEEIQGKFIQFRWQGNEYLLFATREQHRFHNQMLAHFLEEQGIAYRWIDDQTLEIDDVQVEVIGGGRFLRQNSHNLLELWDNSQAYGRFNETNLKAKIHAADHPWSTSRIVIR